MLTKPLPVGVDDFKDLIQNGYYYVDKTLFIKDLLDLKGKVNLFTRPRRFGKTLGVSMLRYFFEDTGSAAENAKNQELFNGLRIMDQGTLYTKEMSRYPVISLSLKSSKQPDWELAYGCLKEEISREYLRHCAVLDSLKTSEQRRRYEDIMNLRGGRQDDITSIRFLADCLHEHWKQNVIILIAEYDVPLENAYFSGFYEEMTDFIRSLFESALKTNPYLEFAVVTGCLRITKESIFTGLNNLEMISILSRSYGEYFGFTQAEIDQMLHDYRLFQQRELMKEWYNGYLFGNTEVYNPWSVMNYIKALNISSDELPAPYWANTSSNSIVKSLVEHADISVRGELEELLAGKTIEKPIHEDITYDTVGDSEDNLWNFLFFTGYLKQTSVRLEGDTRYVSLAIPNMEVRYIYKNTILRWFDQVVGSKDLSRFYRAIEEGDTSVMEEEISAILQETISFYDYVESYYHGFLAGLLRNMKKFRVISNRESGLGRPDILLKTPSVRGMAVVIEIKAVKEFVKMREGCQAALEQIQARKYEESLRTEGYGMILSYGICFYQKECMIMKKK